MIVYWSRLCLCVIAIRYIDDKDAFVYIVYGPKTLTAVCYSDET